MSFKDKIIEYCRQCGYEIQKDGGVYFYNAYITVFGFLYIGTNSAGFYPQLKKIHRTLYGKEVTVVGTEPYGKITCVDYNSFKTNFDNIIKRFKELEQEIKLDEINADFI